MTVKSPISKRYRALLFLDHLKPDQKFNIHLNFSNREFSYWYYDSQQGTITSKSCFRREPSFLGFHIYYEKTWSVERENKYIYFFSIIHLQTDIRSVTLASEILTLFLTLSIEKDCRSFWQTCNLFYIVYYPMTMVSRTGFASSTAVEDAKPVLETIVIG